MGKKKKDTDFDCFIVACHDWIKLMLLWNSSTFLKGSKSCLISLNSVLPVVSLPRPSEQLDFCRQKKNPSSYSTSVYKLGIKAFAHSHTCTSTVASGMIVCSKYIPVHYVPACRDKTHFSLTE